MGCVKVVVEEEEEKEEGVGEGEGEELGAVDEELAGPAVGETSGRTSEGRLKEGMSQTTDSSKIFKVFK